MPVWTPISHNEPHLTIPKQWFSVAFSFESSMIQDEEIPSAHQSPPKKFEALWRTIVADRIGSSNDAAPSLTGDSFQTWLELGYGDLTVSAYEVLIETLAMQTETSYVLKNVYISPSAIVNTNYHRGGEFWVGEHVFTSR